MPQGYCKECRAHVTVRSGACLLGHSVDPSTIAAGSGRHRAARSRRLSHQPVASGVPAQVDVVRIEETVPPPTRAAIADTTAVRPDRVADQSESTSRSISPIGPEPDPEPWQRPLLGRRRLPMLELLGFTDSDEMPQIAIADPDDSNPPSSSSTVANQMMPLTPAVEPARGPAPRLADVQTDDNPENTGVLVARLWDATEQRSLGDDWVPSEAVESPRRQFRWSFISAALAVSVAVALLAVAAYRLPINRAGELRADLITTADSLQKAADAIPATAGRLFDLAYPTQDLSDAALPLLAVSEAANRAYEHATADSTLSIPLISDTPLLALEPAQDALRRAADSALVIHEHLGDVLDYRILLDQALILPELLPVEGTDADISDLGLALSDTIAATTEVLLKLPVNDRLGAHRRQLEAALAEMTSQVADYLSALRSDNQIAASRIVGAMRATAAAARASLGSTLDDFQDWSTDSIAALMNQIDAASEAIQASSS